MVAEVSRASVVVRLTVIVIRTASDPLCQSSGVQVIRLISATVNLMRLDTVSFTWTQGARMRNTKACSAICFN